MSVFLYVDGSKLSIISVSSWLFNVIAIITWLYPLKADVDVMKLLISWGTMLCCAGSSRIISPGWLPPFSRDTWSNAIVNAHITRMPSLAEESNFISKPSIVGRSDESIARILSDQKILTPTAYWRARGEGRAGKKAQPNPYLWKHSTVERILHQQEYCGDVINFKTYSKNFKNKKRIENPEENWVIFKDKHEPIIDRDTFEQVQQKSKRRNAVRQRKKTAPSICWQIIYTVRIATASSGIIPTRSIRTFTFFPALTTRVITAAPASHGTISGQTLLNRSFF